MSAHCSKRRPPWEEQARLAAVWFSLSFFFFSFLIFLVGTNVGPLWKLSESQRIIIYIYNFLFSFFFFLCRNLVTSRSVSIWSLNF